MSITLNENTVYMTNENAVYLTNANTIFLTKEDVFVMKDDGEILKANECSLKYKGGIINFLERDGLYAYSEFFIEGTWPDEYYDDGEKVNEYNGIRLKMLRGGWYSMNELIKVLNSELMTEFRERKKMTLYEETDDCDFDNKLKSAIDCLKKMREENDKRVSFKPESFIEYFNDGFKISF